MADFKYSMETDPKTTARAAGRNMPVSRKMCVELGRAISGKKVDSAREVLNGVISLRRPVLINRFNTNLAHKSGHLGPARFPVKAAEAMLSVLDGAVANAENKGLEREQLFVKVVSATGGVRYYRPRLRWRPQKRKATNIAIIVEQRGEPKPKVEQKEKTEKQTKPEAEKKEKSENKEKQTKVEQKEKQSKAEKKEKSENKEKQTKPEAEKKEKSENKEKQTKVEQKEKQSKAEKKEKSENKEKQTKVEQKEKTENKEKKVAERKPADKSEAKKAAGEKVEDEIGEDKKGGV